MIQYNYKRTGSAVVNYNDQNVTTIGQILRAHAAKEFSSHSSGPFCQVDCVKRQIQIKYNS